MDLLLPFHIPTGGARPQQRAALFSFAVVLVTFLLPLFALFGSSARANAITPLDFNSIRLGAGPADVLIVGGIQGDEPGGFSAASLLATRYEIRKGAIHVVPNLNFPSIIKRSRGLHGDMNRKFDRLDENDPEFPTVRRIQNLISDPGIRLVLNLHDGSGYYRPVYENDLKNPRRWGQSIIIDQENLAENVFMGNLLEQADSVAKEVNARLIKPHHALHVHNTNTAQGDHEMEKSLSYYAARRNKAAFGLEASKEFPTAWRAYYHLAMIEAFLARAGIEFSRDFELSPKGVERALGEHVGISLAGNRVFLPLEEARPAINCLPMPKDVPIITSKPIMAVLPCDRQPGRLCIHYGNRTVANIRPDWREVNEELDAVTAIVDGSEQIAPFGQTIDVTGEVVIQPIPGFRVNAIGFGRSIRDESGIPLRRRDFDSRYSLDRNGNIFRIEVYKGQSFAGMVLVRFRPPRQAASKLPPILPAKKGPESDLGF